MKNITISFPTSIRDVKTLWKEYTSNRYRNNVDAMRKMTGFFINTILNGRWSKVSNSKVFEWNESDRNQFEREMWNECNRYIHNLME